ncbi:hypothetical protein PGTUg99_002631 [Puccinia graminis f. sp. tritici]|uniref:Uncharacterized protein n=1 Tax=Puccinia graminis f. sp. tritici TaxID=56615 RepID=A0A5B0RY09_PUCGR|nr:hypothetical protein PGTUg99_002631 [Puccinia graminis f. sp. tritici]
MALKKSEKKSKKNSTPILKNLEHPPGGSPEEVMRTVVVVPEARAGAIITKAPLCNRWVATSRLQREASGLKRCITNKRTVIGICIPLEVGGSRCHTALPQPSISWALFLGGLVQPFPAKTRANPFYQESIHATYKPRERIQYP